MSSLQGSSEIYTSLLGKKLMIFGTLFFAVIRQKSICLNGIRDREGRGKTMSTRNTISSVKHGNGRNNKLWSVLWSGVFV